MGGEVGAPGPLCRGAAPIARAGLGDARRASPKSGRQDWACWVWARRAQTQQAQSLGRHVVTVPSLRASNTLLLLSSRRRKKIKENFFFLLFSGGGGGLLRVIKYSSSSFLKKKKKKKFFSYYYSL